MMMDIAIEQARFNAKPELKRVRTNFHPHLLVEEINRCQIMIWRNLRLGPIAASLRLLSKS
jgi:hypothetical protein